MEENNYTITLNNTEDQKLYTIDSTIQPLSLTFHDIVTREKIGEFRDVNGVLSFEGNVDESGKIFTDFICNCFNSRIQDLIKKAKEDTDDSI